MRGVGRVVECPSIYISAEKQVWVEGSARLLCSHFYMLESKAFLIELVNQIQFGHIAFRRHWRQEYFSQLRENVTRLYSEVFSLKLLLPLLCGFLLILNFFESVKILEVPH